MLMKGLLGRLMKNWAKISLLLLLIFFVALFVSFNLNKAGFYAELGQYYAKKNNYNKAQDYYEKSYNLGNNDKKFRECYVNLLINSPLTIEAQEKLVRIAEDKNQDSSSESAKYFLYNLKREIHNKYPDNYIQQAPLNQKIAHWGRIPITYSFKVTKEIPQELVNAVNDAFDTWERASSARIRFEKVSRNADIVVSFTNKPIRDAEYGQKYVIAYTVPAISQNKLNRMDMYFNIINLDGEKFTPNEIYNTALHEVFHALGFMGHSFDKSHVMYMSRTNNDIIKNERKKIGDADKATLELLYKIKPDITNANELKYDYIPYPVIGDSAEVNYAKADEAISYIRKAPNIPAGYIDLAQTLINEKNFMGAIANLEKAYRLATNDETRYLALYNLAVAYYYDRKYEMTLFYVEKADELKNEEELHALSAQSYLKLNDTKNAIKEFEYLIKIAPDNLEYTVGLTNIYIKNRNYIKARKVLKEYIKKHPNEKNNPRFKPCRILLL